jgi:hypothetical protein
MADSCNVDEILKQLKALERLREARDSIDEDTLKIAPELKDYTNKLDSLIKEHEAKVESALDECGNLDKSELPEGSMEDWEVPGEELTENIWEEGELSPDSEIEE